MIHEEVLEFGRSALDTYRFHEISDRCAFVSSPNSLRMRLFTALSPAFALSHSAKLNLPGRTDNPIGRRAVEA